MKCLIVDYDTCKTIEVVEAKPVHGKDFCDLCGDCLDCYVDDPCPDTKDGKHSWVVYEKHEDLTK